MTATSETSTQSDTRTWQLDRNEIAATVAKLDKINERAAREGCPADGAGRSVRSTAGRFMTTVAPAW